MHAPLLTKFLASSKIEISTAVLSNLTLITAELRRVLFYFYNRQISCNRANINKIVQANLSRRLFIFYHGGTIRHWHSDTEEYSPNTLEGLINARWYRSFAMKVKRFSRERRRSNGDEHGRRRSDEARRPRAWQPNFRCRRFFRKLMLSLEIKICWASRAHRKRKREIFTLPTSEKLAVPRPPILLLITEVGYSVVITGNFVKLSFKENLTFLELFSGGINGPIHPTYPRLYLLT